MEKSNLIEQLVSELLKAFNILCKEEASVSGYKGMLKLENAITLARKLQIQSQMPNSLCTTVENIERQGRKIRSYIQTQDEFKEHEIVLDGVQHILDLCELWQSEAGDLCRIY